MAAAGGTAGFREAAARAAAAGFAAEGWGAAAGTAAPSGWSPRTDKVLIFRGSLFGIVPFPALTGGGPLGATLATVGGLAFWFSGGNTMSGAG